MALLNHPFLLPSSPRPTTLFLLSLSISVFPEIRIAMKLISSINPKKFFRHRKSSHFSKSEPASFNTVSSSSSSSSDDRRSATPTSVLHSHSQEIAGSAPDVWFELVEAFKLIDRDGDGKIERRELEVVLSRLGAAPPSEEELSTMFAEIDRDGDGCISLEEFAAIRSAFGPASGMEELRETFEVFDADHDGRISAEELLSVFLAIGDERCTLDECRRMIDSVDVNGDGYVCFEDFSRMMEQQQLRC